MKYMLDKVEVHENKEEIIKTSNAIIKCLKDNKKLNASEMLMTIELALAQLNYDLYKISGDNDKQLFLLFYFFDIIVLLEKSDKMIYLDYSATTPVNEEVLDTYVRVTKEFIGNPNSLHTLGVNAKKLIDASTKQIASILKVKEEEIIYTSGASEANNQAIKGICLKYQNRGKHIISTELEHSSVIAPLAYLENQGFDVDFVKLDDDGVVDLEDLRRLMRDDTILVTIASVNSEVGIRQPIEQISKIVREYPKCFFHSDVTQSIGKEIID